MNRNYFRFIKNILIAGDLVVINIAFLVAYILKFMDFDNLFEDEYIILFLVYNVSWIVAAFFLRVYERDRLFLLDKMTIKLVQLLILHSLLISSFWVIRKAYFYSREQLFWTLLILFPLVFIWRTGLSMYIKKFRKKGLNYRKIVLAGAGQLSKEFAQVIKKNKDYGYKVMATFSHKKEMIQNGVKPLSKLEEYCKSEKIDEIYCSSSDIDNDQMKRIIAFADNNIIRTRIIPDVRGLTFKRLSIDFFEHLPVLSFRSLPLDDRYNRWVKRAFDIIFSLFVCVFILSWLFPIIAILIKLSSKGPILFKQKRSGKNNEIFECLKFRSMRVNEDSDKKQATRNDSRVTKIGRFIRKTSIDEMPQFINVLKGDMSIVGPRPHMIKHTEEYGQQINKYMVRHFVKPGITGLAQIKGYRGETSNPKMMENRIRMDMLYVESWNMALDIWIIFRTIFTVFSRNNKAF